MSNPGTPTLDQLQVLLCVVETGSFAAAARRLNRATSAISYAIDHLELQLGLPVFDRVGTRKPELTEAGKAVLAEARTVTHGVDMMRARVKGLLEGLEAEVSIAVDVMLPTARLVDALQAFQVSFPTIPLRLHVEALGAITQLVLEKTAVIGISGPLNTSLEGLDRRHIGAVRLVPVAAPFHPLARHGKKSPGDARNHIQLVLTDRSNVTAGQDFGVIGVKTWRLADLGSKHALLLAGVGWGSMPEAMVRGDIEAGRLVPLDLPDWHVNTYDMHAIYRTDTPPGPAAQWLIERFAGQA
ncbi:putative HTH-type transcriptional regulator YahB (plasmid) [Asticcacaulis sp. MM231]|uniref:LysR family transcriptional regulator n=1 Tax=Asticcacaulis sp. MM231 TaxID=3157666 RepID=UPI0032D59F85